MALSMRERLGLQKQVKTNLAALRGGDAGMRERLRLQKEVKADIAKLKGADTGSDTPAAIDPAGVSPGDSVVWRNENGEIYGNYRGLTDDGQNGIVVHDGQQSAAPIGEIYPDESGEGGAPAPTPKSDSEAALEASSALFELKPFIAQDQFKTLVSLTKRGEEVQAYRDKVLALKDRIDSMPVTYEQDGKGMDSVAYLHYFTSAGDYYITEKDMEGNGTTQAFGHADAGMGMGELGYISIAEITQAGAELDLYFDPTPLKQVVKGAGEGGDSGGEGGDEEEEQHYSDLILKALVEHHGWSPAESSQGKTAEKDVGGQAGGQINPDGARLVTAQFMGERRRYLQLVAGFEKPVTADGRPALSGEDADVRAVAADFNSQVTEWAVENAVDPGTLKVEANRTPEQPDTLTTQAAEGNFNALPLPDFIEKLKEAYSADEDLEGAKVAAVGYLEANRDDLEDAA